MSLSRRRTLALLGGGTILAAGAATGTFLGTRTPTRALAPWGLAGTYGEVRRDALSYALLAPNPHNRQPWVFDLEGEDRVVIYRDPELDLPETDPFARQLTIGMGCFIELMEMAAAEAGYGVETELFPDGDADWAPVARCRFEPGGAGPDPLFAHVLERRSHKELFDATPVEAGAEDALAPYAQVYRGEADVQALREIAKAAWLTEAQTPATWQESIDLLRIGKSEINANPDGIDLGGPMFDTLKLLGLANAEDATDPDNPNYRIAVQSMLDAVDSAPAFVVQVTQGNAREDQIDTGRKWLLLNLATTAAGMALRPVSQALQEFPEMSEHYRDAHAMLAPGGGTVQMLGLLGYASQTPRTPRWPLDTKIRNA